MAGWWATLVIGVAVLLFGRWLFWLFVGAVGFAVGLEVARAAFAGSSEWLVVLAALALGVIGAVLAIAFQWLAVGLGGFAAGAYASLAAAAAWGLESPWSWAIAVAVGIVTAALILWLWDPVLIVLSALTGAVLLTPLAPVSVAVRPWLFVGLLLLGIVIQTTVLARPAPPPRRRDA